jgi:hypothetical protein
MASDYLDRSKAANNAMGTKAKAVRSEQRRVANIIANKVGNAIGYVVEGPKEAQKYQQVGVLGSRGFVQAAAKVAGVADKRFGINALRTAVTGKASNLPYLDGVSPFLNQAAAGARRELVATSNPGSAYTALRNSSANIGREMAGDVRKVEYAIDKFGPASSIARDQILKWHAKRAKATAMKQEGFKALAPKGTTRTAK